jgi:phospholipid/cholesterol/gamma-HCH transport system substrate-binding protein
MTALYKIRLTGAAVVLVVAAVAVVALSRPSNPLKDRYTYYAVFDSAQGLGPIDRDVRVAGVKIGTIDDVVRQGDDVRVKLVLDEDVTLHRDATAAMRPHTLFEGSNFVDLSPGSPSARRIEEGTTIPKRQTRNYVTLDEALRVFRPDIRQNLRTLAEVGSETVQGEAVDGLQQTLRSAPPLMRDLAPATRALRGTDGDELAGAVRGLSQTVDAVETEADDLAPLVTRTQRTTAALTVDDGQPLDATLAALPPALRELRTSAPAVTGVVQRTERLARGLTPALPDVAAALRGTTPALRRTIPVAREATPLVRDARLITARLGGARNELVEMFELTEPSLKKFNSLFAQFNAPTSLGAPTGVTQLVGGAFSGLNATFRPFQTSAQNPTAPGHTGRIGTYVNPLGLVGLTESLGLGPRAERQARQGVKAPSCESIRQVSAQAERVARLAEQCR